jgi:arsenical pump membrane protein
MLTQSSIEIYTISAVATSGVIIRPWQLPEAIWAALGAIVLVAVGLITLSDATVGIVKGLDVYFFLAGMMLLAELARREGLFDWLAALAAEHARGSAFRLFTLIYLVAVGVTVFLSNDATAVVLTPAVYAAARAAKASALPLLLVCAFVANAASFVLPISNPANLVVFGAHMPTLAAWLRLFIVPSVLAIAATYAALWLTQRSLLRTDKLSAPPSRPKLSLPGVLCACGIAAAAAVLLVCAALEIRLGLPTLLAGCATAFLVLAASRRNPWIILKNISWEVLVLVAGLFVLVEAVDKAGGIRELSDLLRDAAHLPGIEVGVGTLLALACNMMNNLPVGLIAGSVLAADRVSDSMRSAMLIGVDLGPNLSVTGSLATILWLIALRREGEKISGFQFLKLGALVMPPALILALVATMLIT